MPVSRRTDSASAGMTIDALVEMRRAVPNAPANSDGKIGSLADRFLLPPFSVLNAREGYWQRRKRFWLALGIQSELGRGEQANDRAELDSARMNDAAGGQKRYKDNGLLGYSEQARSHYRMNDAADWRGRPLSQTFNSGRFDARVPWFREGGAHPIPGGSTGKNSAYLFKTKDGYKPLKEIQEGNRLTWVGGDRPVEDLDEVSLKNLEAQPQSGTSIFDPVLCEIADRWFCPQSGRVLDPFAGGSVRGVVAAKLGRAYAGVDLRQEQADANYDQAEVICPDADLTWVVGDSRNIDELLPGEYDLVFSCPPYFDLERYSDDPRDLSTMDYTEFLRVYRDIIAKSCAMLRDDRFAVFVVGDVRNRATGNYRNFVGDTVEAFRAAGLGLYNEAILVTAVGSLPIRVGQHFAGYRKLGRTHQNVLVFLKGDAGRASAACGEVDVDDLSMPETIEGGAAMCRQDAAGTVAAPYLMDRGEYDVSNVYLPPTESFLLCDVVRGRARLEGRAVPRTWVGTADGWQRVEDGADLTHLVGNRVYLNKVVFPNADGPTDAPPPPQRMR